MSTTITVAVVKPNHLPVYVHVEHKNGAQWTPTSEGFLVKVGESQSVLVHGLRRVVIEEVTDHK